MTGWHGKGQAAQWWLVVRQAVCGGRKEEKKVVEGQADLVCDEPGRPARKERKSLVFPVF